MLKTYIRLFRSRGATHRAQKLQRELEEAQDALRAAEERVRRGTHQMFSAAICSLAPGEERTHFDGPTRVEIAVAATEELGQFRVTFRHLAVGHEVSLRCAAEDVNTIAELVVRGEQALLDGDQTGRNLGMGSNSAGSGLALTPGSS